MSTPRGHNEAKVHSVFYSFKGVWLEEPEEALPPVDRFSRGKETDEQKQRRANERKVKVDIYVHKTTDDRETNAPPFPISRIEFEMRCEEVKTKCHNHGDKTALSFTGSDIELVRKAMWGALDKHFATKWDRFILVEVEVGKTYSSNAGSRIDLSWRDVWRGTAFDGTFLLRENGYPRGYKVTPWPGEFKDEGGKILALIPETPENEQALQDFKRRFEDVGKAIRSMLEPKNIARTFAVLAQAKRLPLLPFKTGGGK